MAATKFTGRVTAGCAVLALAAGIAGCGSSSSAGTTSAGSAKAAAQTQSTASVPFASPESKLPTSYPAPSRGHFTIGYLNPSGGQESLNALQTAFERQVQKHGGKVIALDANLSVDQQVSEMQTLINDKVNAIAVYPLDPGALGPLVKRANAAHIPVVGLEITLAPGQPLDGFTSQIWLGPDETAYQIAKGIAAAKPHANLGLIGYAAPVPYIRTIVARVKYWAHKFGLNVLGEQDNKDDSISGGANAATGLLGQYPDMNAIFAYNDDSALGAYSSVRAAGRRNNVVIFANNGASEGIQAVKNHEIAATFQFDAVGTGYLTADAALDAAQKKKLPPAVIVAMPKEITAANSASAKTWEQQLAAAG